MTDGEIVDTFDAIDAAQERNVQEAADRERDDQEDELEIPDRDQRLQERSADLDDVDREIVDTQTHELGAKLLFSDPDDGLSPYYAIRSIVDEMIEYQGSDDPLLEDVVGDDWRIPEGKALYWTGAIAADGEDYDAFDEYQLPLVADDALEDDGRQATIQFRPALPNAETVDGGDVNLPDDMPYGIRVDFKSSNVEIDEIIPLLQAAADRLGIRRSYFSPEKIHDWSTIYNAARYVRVDRHVSEHRIVGAGKLLDRLAGFGRQAAGGRGMYKWDNEEIMGHYTAVAMCADSWSKLLPGRSIGARLKSYHMKNPESTVGSTTSHPKLEIQLSGEYTVGSISWSDRDDLMQQLDETLVNALKWAGLGLDPDDPAYVDDEYFSPHPDAGGRDHGRDLRLVDDPIDDVVEVERDLATLQLLDADLSEKQGDVVELLADGGRFDAETLAEESGVGTSTVYRAISKVDSVVRRVDGQIEIVDDVIRDQLSSLFSSIERAAEYVDQGLDEIVSSRYDLDPEDPFSKWLQRYGGSISDLSPFDAPTTGRSARDWIEIDLSLGQFTRDEIKAILRAGGLAARETRADLLDDLRRAVVTYRDRDGERREMIVAASHGGIIKCGGAPVR